MSNNNVVSGWWGGAGVGGGGRGWSGGNGAALARPGGGGVLHCEKSLGDFRAIARSAAGNKWYSTEFSEVKIRAIAGYSTEPRTISCYSWEYSQF